MIHFSKLNWSFILLIFLIGALFSFNDSSADADYYYTLYEDINRRVYFSVEPGFVFLCTFFKNLGFSYIQFRIVIGLLVVILIGSTILRYSKYPSLVLICYFCYPFLLDCAQVRHMIACSIFIYSIRFLEIYNLRNLVSFIICIIIASSIQMIAWAFLCFLPIYIFRNKKIFYTLCLFCTIILFLSITMVMKLPIIRYLLELRSKEGAYELGIPISQLILYLIFYIGIVIIAVNMKSSTQNVAKESFLARFSMLSLIFLPILLVDFQFTRLFRACLIPIYILCWNNISAMRQDNRSIVGGIMLIVFALVFYKLFISSANYYESLTYPILLENLLVK